MAGKPPAFQFYAVDFLMGTHYMTNAQVGAYIRLLASSWDKGPVPLSPEDRAQWLFMPQGDTANANELWDSIAHKWVKTRAGFINKRLESIRAKYAAYAAAQAVKGRRSGEARARKAKPKSRQSNHGSTPVQPVLNRGGTAAQPRSNPGPLQTTPRAHLGGRSHEQTAQKSRNQAENQEESSIEPRFNHGSTGAEPVLNSSSSDLRRDQEQQTQDQDHACGVEVDVPAVRPTPSHKHLVKVAHDVLAGSPEGSSPTEIGENLKDAAAKLRLVYDSGSIAKAVAVAMLQAAMKRGEARPTKAGPGYRPAGEWGARAR